MRVLINPVYNYQLQQNTVLALMNGTRSLQARVCVTTWGCSGSSWNWNAKLTGPCLKLKRGTPRFAFRMQSSQACIEVKTQPWLRSAFKVKTRFCMKSAYGREREGPCLRLQRDLRVCDVLVGGTYFQLFLDSLQCFAPHLRSFASRVASPRT